MKKFLLTIIAFVSITMSADAQKLYATPGECGSNAKVGNYTWTANNNNLLPVFEFKNGELANYTKLHFTLSNLKDGTVRMGYFVGSTFTEFGNNGFGSNGSKDVDLTTLGIDLSKVTKISFGGRTFNESATSGSVNLSSVYLLKASGEKLGPSYDTPASNATFIDYTWTDTNNNLWTLFEFTNGELANYTTLTFTINEKTNEDGPVRMGYYVGSAFTEFGNGYYSDGSKTVDLTALNIDLSTVTKIAFGGKGVDGGIKNGAVNLRNVYLEGHKELALTDGAAYPFTNSPDFTATSATYSRTCSSQWGTLCLPFEIKGTYDGVTFYSLNKVEDDVMYFTPVSGSIAAGTPVVFKMNATGTLSISESNVAVVSNPVDAVNGSWTMQGTFTSQDFMYGYSNYYYIAGDKFWNDGFTAAPYRGWFVGPATSGSAPYRISTGDDTEGLQYVEQEDGSVKVYYDIQGRKADSTRKGLVIENGKLMMVK